MKLVDANLLIYAFDSSSPFFEDARAWLEGIYATDDAVGLPRVCLLAFLKIVTNPRLSSPPVPTADALERVEDLLNHPKTIVIEPGPRHWETFRNLVMQSGVQGPSMTDAFLAALAIEHGATLCSHDQGFRRFTGLSFANPLT